MNTAAAITTTFAQPLDNRAQEFPIPAAPVMTSWSNFTRGSSAAGIIGTIPIGTYIEIKDRKFAGDSLIVLRRTDFEKLVKSSRSSFQIKKVLFSIEKTALTFQDGSDPKKVIEAVREIASLGVELAASNPSFPSANEYLAHVHAAREETDDVDFDLPRTRSELKHGIKKRK